MPPASGSIPVAFLLSRDAVVIDLSGPWEVFSTVSVPERAAAAFSLYTVAESAAPLTASGGLTIVPHFTFTSAPAPRVLVIPAQHGATVTALAWIRTVIATTDLTLSVCTGAFILARSGLLHGMRTMARDLLCRLRGTWFCICAALAASRSSAPPSRCR
jgi:transcriptional regulator GlxA family with amidase domain